MLFVQTINHRALPISSSNGSLLLRSLRSSDLPPPTVPARTSALPPLPLVLILPALLSLSLLLDAPLLLLPPLRFVRPLGFLLSGKRKIGSGGGANALLRVPALRLDMSEIRAFVLKPPWLRDEGEE